MSDDDFFYDKDKSSLHYIKSKTGTKIDDILKRRRAKQIKEANDLKSETFLSLDDSVGKIENEQKQEYKNDIVLDNKSDIYSKNYSIYEGKYKINNDSDVCEKKNSCSIKDSFIDNTYYMNNGVCETKYINNSSKKTSSNTYDKECIYKDPTHDTYIAINSVNESSINNIPCNKLKSELTSCNNIEIFQNKNKNQTLYEKSLEHIKEYKNNILIDDYNENEIEEKEKKAQINYYDNELGILKTPSTEVILNKIKSNDDGKSEIYANLNKIDINDIDMNKTPSKSISKSYFEYLKFETAGKMNMSELETPLNLKEEDVTNTPFITYYLAGKVKNKNISSNENLENNLKENLNEKEEIDNNKESEHSPINYYLKESNMYDKELSKQEEFKKKGNKVEDNFKENEKSTNDEDTASITSNNKYSEDYIYNNNIHSKKYNFIKTEEQYKNMLKEQNNKNDNIIHGNNSKRLFNNDMNFTNKNFSNYQLDIMNTKTFKMNFFKDLKLNNNESNIYLSDYKEKIKSFSFENPLNIGDKKYEENYNSRQFTYNNSNDERYDKMNENYKNKLYGTTQNFEKNNYSSKNTILISSNMKKEVIEGNYNIDNINNNNVNNNNVIRNSVNNNNVIRNSVNNNTVIDNSVNNNAVIDNSVKNNNVNNNNHNNESHLKLYKNLDVDLTPKNNLLHSYLTKCKISTENSFTNKYNEENDANIDNEKILNNEDYENDNHNYIYKMENNINNINSKKYVDHENIEITKADENYINKNNTFFHENNNKNNSYNLYNNSKNYVDKEYSNIYKNYENVTNKSEYNDLEEIKIKSNVKMDISGMNENNHHANYENRNISNEKDEDSFKIKLHKMHDRRSINETNNMNKNYSNRNVTNEYVTCNNTIKHSNIDLFHESNLKKKDSNIYEQNNKNNNPIISIDNKDMDYIIQNNKNVYNENNSIYNHISENNNNTIKLGNMNRNIHGIKTNDFNNISVNEKNIFSTINKNVMNKLSETADFGYKEINDTCESKNTDIRMDDHNNYNLDINEINDASNLKKSYFYHLKNNFNDINNIKNIIFDSPHQNKQSAGTLYDTFSKEVNNEIFNEYILDQIKSSINIVVEKILSNKQHNIMQKLHLSVSDNEINRNEAPEVDFHKKYNRNSNTNNNELKNCCNCNYENEERANDEDKINSEAEIKSKENYSKKFVDSKYENRKKSDFIHINEENILKNIHNTENFDDTNLSQNENKKKKKASIIKLKSDVDEFNEEDFHEIDKLNENLKMSKINKIIEINKSDLQKLKIKWRDILYGCIDVIYYLLNENNKKNNKMNNLMSEISNINEYEKKIENLTKENEKLKVEIEQKSENSKKKEIKERATLNKKITEQSKKIASYDKDINIYRNKINNLNNKIANKENEIEKLKKQYQVVLEEIDNCKNDANKVIKKVLNKKFMNLVDKQCFDISKYYEIQINSLNKEIKNLKDIIKSEAKEKIILTRKINELEIMNKDIKKESKNKIAINSTNELEIENEKKKKKKEINGDDKLINEDKKLKKNKAEKNINNSCIEKSKELKMNENLNESKYKTKYQNLVKEMNEIKKDFENQKMLYSKKIEQLEQNQEIQNMKNQLDVSEKIVQVYQNIFRENVNNIKNDHSYNQYCNKDKDMKKNNYSCVSYQENKNYIKDSNNVDLNYNSNKSNFNDFNAMNSFFMQAGINKINNFSSHNNLITSNRDVEKNNSCLLNDSNLRNIVNNVNTKSINGVDKIEQHHYLNDFVKMYIENFHMNDSYNNYKCDFDLFQKQSERVLNNSKNNFINNDDNDFLYKNLMNYEKVELIKIFINICNDLKADNIFVVIQFVKFLSYIVYEQFPLFTSFYYNVASLVSTKSVTFNECIDILKKWKTYYINGKKYYIFRKNVLLIFQSDLKDVKKNLLDEKCLDLMKNLYEKNSEISKYSNDSYEKAEYIINKHSKEIISKIIKTYMNIYNIDKINNIISHINSMNSKLKTQSYFIRSISTCLNLRKTDNFQEIENKIKELVSTKVINEKIKNKIKIEEIDEYLAAYTIIGTLKKYLSISHTKDLLPSISKIIQKNRSL